MKKNKPRRRIRDYRIASLEWLEPRMLLANAVSAMVEYQAYITGNSGIGQGWLPVRGALVEALDPTTAADVGQAYTGNDGSLAITLSQPEATVDLKIIAQSQQAGIPLPGNGRTLSAYTVGTATGGPTGMTFSAAPFSLTVASLLSPSGQVVDQAGNPAPVQITAGLVQGTPAAAYFSVFDALTSAAAFRNSLQPYVGFATAQFYVNSSPAFTLPAFRANAADPSASQAVIPEPYAYSWDTIWHEYGHWTQNADGVAPPGINVAQGESHGLTTNLSGPFGAKGLPLAFSEGYADYFAMAVQATIAGTRQASVPYVAGTLFTSWHLSAAGAPIPTSQFDIAAQTGLVGDGTGGLAAPANPDHFKSNGRDQELAVSRLLYSLSKATVSGNAPLGDAGVWNLIRTNEDLTPVTVKTVDDLQARINAAAAALPDPDEAKYLIVVQALLTAQGMTAQLNPNPQQQGALPNQAPDDGGVQTYSYNPGGPAPVFSFNIPQVTDPPAGAPEDELNAFSVVFLDANYNEIDYSVVDSNGDYSDEDVDGFTGLAAVANSSGVFVGGSYIAPLDESTSTVSWQPTTAEWQVIAAANPAYWEVVGRNGAEYFPIVDGQSTAPAGFVDTGDYTSAAQPITVLPAPQVSVTYPDGTGEDVPADATIGIPFTTSQPLTVNYTMYTQTLTTEPNGNGGYIVTGSGTIAQAGSGSVTFAAGSDDDEDVTLPGVYLDPAQQLVTLIVVSLPGETVPDSAAVAGIGSSWVGDSEDQAWPIYVGTDENISVTATTPTTTYGGDPGVVQFTRSGDTSLPMLITPWGGTTGDSIVSSENGVSMPGAEESGQTALYFPPGVATTDVDVTATAASTYAGSDYGVEIGGGGETNGDGFGSATVTVSVPAVPTVSISGGGTIDEAWGSTYLTITRTGPTTASLPVFFQVSGTATMGQDYFTLPSDPSARPEAARAFSAAAADSSPGATWPSGYVAQRAAEACYAIAL